MKLYELTTEWTELFDRLEAISECDRGVFSQEDLQEAWFNTLIGIEEEFEEKAEKIGAYLKALCAEAAAIKGEEAALSARRKTKEKQIEWLKKYLLESMQAIGRKKIDRPMAVLSVRNKPESVRFDDENAFITLCQKTGHDEYLRYKPPEIDRTYVKEALKRGEKIEGAYLAREQRIDIK